MLKLGQGLTKKSWSCAGVNLTIKARVTLNNNDIHIFAVIAIKLWRSKSNPIKAYETKLTQTKPNDNISKSNLLKNILVKNHLWSRKNFVKKYLCMKHFAQKKLGKKNIGKKNLAKKRFGWNKFFFYSKKFWSKIVLDPNKFKVKKLFGTKNVWLNKIGSEFFLE